MTISKSQQSDPNLLFQRAFSLHQTGKLDRAIEIYLQLFARFPKDAQILYLLGTAKCQMGDFADGASYLEKSIKINHRNTAAYNNRGNALKELHRFDEALICFNRALQLNPTDSEIFYNKAEVLKLLGRLQEAVTSYEHAIQIKPDFADAHNNLGVALKELWQLDGAAASFRTAIRLKPNLAEAYLNLGCVLEALGQFNDAIANYRLALQLNPDNAEAHNNLGIILNKLNLLNSSLDSFRRAMALQPMKLNHAFVAHLLLPVIPESSASITERRERYRDGIATLMNIPGTLDEPGDKLSSPSFYLAYHNANDRPLMEALNRLFRARLPELTTTAPHIRAWLSPSRRGQRIRVGFLSQYLVDHTIGLLNQGLIRHLDRSRFEVVVIHAPKAKHDAFRQNLDALANKFITLPTNLTAQQQVIAAEQLDVLFYPDIGMTASTYFLAFARLAPVQATSWGHPDTTGLDTIDYFVSATTIEPDDAELHYTERLIRLNRLPSFYEIPEMLDELPTRSELGLPETGTLYGCPQTLYKFHPDFDAVLAAIAEGDPEGRIVLLEGTYSPWTDLLKARWKENFPVLLDSVLFLPPMSRKNFIALQGLIDVLLDPIHFGGGNTFYEAMIYGTPIVTWPGQFMRGRIVTGGYRQMSVEDAPIALQLEDYAPLALALGRDSKRRRALREVSVEAAGRELFEDMKAVREFEVFLEAAVDAVANGEKLPAGWRPGI